MLRSIAIYKLVKAALLVFVGLYAFRVLHPAIVGEAKRVIVRFAASSDHALLRHIAHALSDFHPTQLKIIGTGAMVYAALDVVEGIGLWRQKAWGEYLTLVTTAALIPIEVYELTQRFTAARVAILVLNILVVAYLTYRIRKDQRRAS